MRPSILLASRHIERIGPYARLLGIRITSECEFLVDHEAIIVYKEKRCWWIEVPGPGFNYCDMARDLDTALHIAWSRIRWDHWYYCADRPINDRTRAGWAHQDLIRFSMVNNEGDEDNNRRQNND